MVTEHELVARSEAFEQAIAGGDRSALCRYCDAKAAEVGGKAPEEAETWAFLGLMFAEDARRQLLSKLGFNDCLPAAPAAEGPAANGDVHEAAAGMQQMGLSGERLRRAMMCGVLFVS